MTEAPEHGSARESREIASALLNAMALAGLVVAVTAFAVMCMSWLLSGQTNATRDWPSAGWLICVPALAAALTFVSAAESMARPRPVRQR